MPSPATGVRIATTAVAMAASAVLGLVSACAPRAAAPVLRRSQIVPLVEHHQHLVGPMLIDAPPAPLPTIELPAELAAVLRAREAASGKTAPSEVFTADALVLDVSRAEDHWRRGREAAQEMASAHTPDTRFVPNAYAVDGTTGYIAGTVRTGESTVDEMHFVFGLRREGGAWRIALEYATNKPLPTFAAPITADVVIAHLDDAGIERAVVLSVAYWLASPLRETPVADEAARVREANDWTVAQVARYPARLVAFCAVNPLSDHAIAEAERCARLPGVKGMKLHFGNSGVDVKDPAHVAKLRAFFRACNRARLALVVHLWTLDKSYGAAHSQIFLDEILPEAPDVVVQLAHLAGAGRYAHDDALAVFADAITRGDPRLRHVYFDLTTVVTEGMSEETAALVVRRLRQVGMERVLFGSDTILATRPPPLLAWAMVRRLLPLTDAELRQIAGNVAPYLR